MQGIGIGLEPLTGFKTTNDLGTTKAVMVVVVNELAEWVLEDPLERWVREHVVP